MSDNVSESSVLRLFHSTKSLNYPTIVVTSDEAQEHDHNINDKNKSFLEISKLVKRNANENFYKSGNFQKTVVERTPPRVVVFNDVKNILSKPVVERTEQDLTDLAIYLKDTKFFNEQIAENEDFGNEESKLQSLKMWFKALNFEQIEEGDFVMKIGEYGTKFYIMLRGKVAVRVKSKVEKDFYFKELLELLFK